MLTTGTQKKRYTSLIPVPSSVSLTGHNKRKLGSVNLAPTGQSVSPTQGAEAGAAAGAAFGPVGAGVGAAVGVVVGLLSAKPNTAAHIGGWDTQITQAIQGLPSSAAGIGRQIPWNENSHGLVQFIEALLATGVYMAWDPSLISNYDVCAHWATTFAAAVQSLTTTIVNGPVGAQCSAPIVFNTAASGIPNNNFVFTNPGISVGPDQISASLIMGSSGLMYWMITTIGETTAHASSNANNALAQKVYALMVDNIAATLAPAQAVTPTPPPVVAPAVAASSQTVNAAVASSAMPAPTMSQTAPPPTVVVEQAPLPAVQPISSGIDSTTLLYIAAGLAAVYFVTRK
jgi:hypothetical protein